MENVCSRSKATAEHKRAPSVTPLKHHDVVETLEFQHGRKNCTEEISQGE